MYVWLFPSVHLVHGSSTGWLWHEWVDGMHADPCSRIREVSFYWWHTLGGGGGRGDSANAPTSTGLSINLLVVILVWFILILGLLLHSFNIGNKIQCDNMNIKYHVGTVVSYHNLIFGGLVTW